MKRKNNPNKKKAKKQVDGIIKYSGLAFQMIVIILMVLYAGFKLDEYLQNEFPLFTIIGAFLGVILSLYFALKDLIRMK
ncbi:AtpZ/AtpI family protein [Marinifilum sp. RC60d5]|uniref:AtpZ/AtpI family protein n=1 Tax=Marinifilum sp. RC60d5 TaxID=3458414 RepID=UPI004035E9C4